jgi:hypothetical protein
LSANIETVQVNIQTHSDLSLNPVNPVLFSIALKETEDSNASAVSEASLTQLNLMLSVRPGS